MRPAGKRWNGPDRTRRSWRDSRKRTSPNGSVPVTLLASDRLPHYRFFIAPITNDTSGCCVRDTLIARASRAAENAAEHTAQALPPELAADRACCGLRHRLHHSLAAVGPPDQVAEPARLRGPGFGFARRRSRAFVSRLRLARFRSRRRWRGLRLRRLCAA